MEEINERPLRILNKSSLNLTQPLLTNAVQQKMQPFDQSNQPILNNGIVKDGGITSVYWQTKPHDKHKLDYRC